MSDIGKLYTYSNFLGTFEVVREKRWTPLLDSVHFFLMAMCILFSLDEKYPTDASSSCFSIVLLFFHLSLLSCFQLSCSCIFLSANSFFSWPSAQADIISLLPLTKSLIKVLVSFTLSFIYVLPSAWQGLNENISQHFFRHSGSQCFLIECIRHLEQRTL